MVVPRANFDPRPCEAVLVLQRGENPSTDYYLRPRLEAPAPPARIVDLDSLPERCGLLAADGPASLLVIVCRYVNDPWLDALEAARGRLARVAFFMDDDLPEMMRDPALPASVRGKAALHFGAHVDRLSSICSEVWASTAALRDRYPDSRAAVLPPLAEADLPAPAPGAERRVVYHGTDVHEHERLFVIEVARRLREAGCDAPVEIVGGPALVRACAGVPGVRVIPQLPWPEHRQRQRQAPAAISLAPLQRSPLNDARAPVKAFDAARLGAAGLYADVAPYGGFVRNGVDGLLLPMDPDAWSAAIVGLLADAGRRAGLANAARARLSQLRASDSGLPPPAA